MLLRPHGQAVKTPPSHGGIRGSIPLEATREKKLRFCLGITFGVPSAVALVFSLRAIRKCLLRYAFSATFNNLKIYLFQNQTKSVKLLPRLLYSIFSLYSATRFKFHLCLAILLLNCASA